MRGPWLITPHAVDRYVERVRRVARGQAVEDLIAMAAAAHRVKARPDGLWIHRGPKPRRLRLIVDESCIPPRLVTVLTAFDREVA